MPYVFTLRMIRLALAARQFFDLPLSYRYQDGAGSIRSPLNAVYAIAPSLHPLSSLLLALLLPISGPLSHAILLLFAFGSRASAEKPPLNQSLLCQFCRAVVTKYRTRALPRFGFGWLVLAARQFFDLSLPRGGYVCIPSGHCTRLSPRNPVLHPPHLSGTLDPVAAEAGIKDRIRALSVDALFQHYWRVFGLDVRQGAIDHGLLPSYRLTKTALRDAVEEITEDSDLSYQQKRAMSYQGYASTLRVNQLVSKRWPVVTRLEANICGPSTQRSRSCCRPRSRGQSSGSSLEWWFNRHRQPSFVFLFFAQSLPLRRSWASGRKISTLRARNDFPES